jgi:gamma-butyrobetaine dioxygenase
VGDDNVVNAIVDEIFSLFDRYGAGHYGEDLSLGTHMLQSANLAASLSAPDDVIAAALLHDIGYFLHADAAASISAGYDFQHEIVGAAWLSRGFGANVTAPIALHVSAKRYLCAVEPDYAAGLSDASRLTLAAQGGIMNAAEVAAFRKDPAFDAALLLRRCDDRGKDVALQTQDIRTYRALLNAALRQSD